MTTSATSAPPRELDRRATDGVDVALLWDAATDSLSVAVYDDRTGEAFELQVDAHEAVDAFRHPYAYAAFRGVDYQVPTRSLEPVGA